MASFCGRRRRRIRSRINEPSKYMFTFLSSEKCIPSSKKVLMEKPLAVMEQVGTFKANKLNKIAVIPLNICTQRKGERDINR